MSGRDLTYKQRQELEALTGRQFIHPKNTAPARIMGVVEGYVVARYKGCVPWLIHWREFKRECRLLNDIK